MFDVFFRRLLSARYFCLFAHAYGCSFGLFVRLLDLWPRSSNSLYDGLRECKNRWLTDNRENQPLFDSRFNFTYAIEKQTERKHARYISSKTRRKEIRRATIILITFIAS